MTEEEILQEEVGNGGAVGVGERLPVCLPVSPSFCLSLFYSLVK